MQATQEKLAHDDSERELHNNTWEDEKRPGESITPGATAPATGEDIAPARSWEKDFPSSPSPQKLESRVMGPGLNPPLKRDSMEPDRGGRVMVGRGGSASFHGGRSPPPPPAIQIQWKERKGSDFCDEKTEKKVTKEEKFATFLWFLSLCLN